MKLLYMTTNSMTVRDYVTSDRVQLHKNSTYEKSKQRYFIYNKVTKTVKAYYSLDDLVEDFLFEVNIIGMRYLDKEWYSCVEEIYKLHLELEKRI